MADDDDDGGGGDYGHGSRAAAGSTLARAVSMRRAGTVPTTSRPAGGKAMRPVEALSTQLPLHDFMRTDFDPVECARCRGGGGGTTASR